jgi:5-formyltetrahydrofolate cyclo-ligase
MLVRVLQLSCFEMARTILGYVSMGAEADPACLLGATVSGGRAVFLPSPSSSDGDAMWVDGHAPSEGAAVRRLSARSLAHPIVALVPGVGFDVRGVRLGRGQGFYDRVLLDLRRAGRIHVIGLAFECQIVAELPSDSWDQRVDFVASEGRMLTPATATGLQGATSAR